MPRRVTLTDRQKDALLRLPTSQADLLKHYTLSDEDLGHIRGRNKNCSPRHAKVERTVNLRREPA